MLDKIIKEIDIDFYYKKNITIEAKQYDLLSRYILISCYNQGNFCKFYPDINSAYIRYRKPDGFGTFNKCTINSNGKILVELTEQMLASSGNCYADIIVLDDETLHRESGDDTVFSINENGELILDNNRAIISTMNFCVNVVPTALNNSKIESSYEFNALNDLIIKATKEYEYVIQQAKQYAANAEYYANRAETLYQNINNTTA